MNNQTINNLTLQSHMLAIYKRYPSIFSYERVSVCSKIYYPISIVDVLVEESIRQPFSPSEQIILELIKSGIDTTAELEHAIGLPELYIQGILQDLEGEQLIKDFKLTAKGEYGHEQKVKFSTSMHKQSLQFDPIIHEVLTHMEIDEQYFVPSHLTNSGLTHFLPHSYFEQNELEQSFDAVQEHEMKVTGKRIKEVLAVKTYFVEAVALLFNLIPHPFIFFPNKQGHCDELLFLSEANLNYMKEDDAWRLTIDRTFYYEHWLYVKQIKDEMKKKQDNQILLRDIKAKISQQIHFCKEEHTVITESGVTVVFDFNDPFSFSEKHFHAIQSLEWTTRNIPFFVLDNEEDYSNFIAYSECYDRNVYKTAKLMFELEQCLEGPESLFSRMTNIMNQQSIYNVTIEHLYDILTQIQTEQILSSQKDK